MIKLFRTVLILALIGAVGAVAFAAGKFAARARIQDLTDYGNRLVAEYTDDGVLPDTKTRDEVLDRFEDHLKQDRRFERGVNSYERTESSVTVDIKLVKFVFAPRVKGIG